MAKSGKSRPIYKGPSRQWRRMDLHIHTPASSDYQEPNTSYLDILRQAEARELDIIAFTDHNTVSGFAAMNNEIEELVLLKKLDRLQADEERKLTEYLRLMDRICILPGFEFTATFGFHILGIFPPGTPVAFLEHLLLTLNIPLDQLKKGSSTVGATSDVLTVYRIINQNGGLVIAAHANSSNGVGMRGLDFGGQTKIAFTQDSNLNCLEVTDLEKHGRYTTRRFFDGSKPEYPRAMRCIQGSDAHRLVRESTRSKNLGIGDRVTEILLEEVSFEGISEVIRGNDFSLTRPYRGPATPVDFVLLAREEGSSIVQSFHTSTNKRGGHLDRILEDVCAMANTNGGTIYIGLSSNPKGKIAGIRDPQSTVSNLTNEITRRLTPDPNVEADSLISSGKTVVRITIPPGRELPYAIDDNRFYVRDEAETTLAVRDEIVRLVERRLLRQTPGVRDSQLIQESVPAPEIATRDEPRKKEKPRVLDVVPDPVTPADYPSRPRTGVEIVSSEERNGTIYHTVRDLRNGNHIKNVTRSSARKLWHYAITKAESGENQPEKFNWDGNMAFLNQRRRDSHVWYDLAMRDAIGVHVYYGVTDSGLNDEWMKLVDQATQ